MRKILLPIAVILAATVVNAQSTLTGSDLNPTIGHTSTSYTGSYVSEGNSGANQIWDLSTLNNASSSTATYSASTASGCNIRMTQVASGATSTADFQMDNTGQYIHVMNAQGITFNYSDPMMQLYLPLTYQGTHDDTFSTTFSYSGYTFTRSGTNSQEVDGYGTVITPEGTFTNVLRVHLHQEYSDVSSFGTINYVAEIYTWYKAGVKDPLASVSTLDSDQGSSSYGTYLETNGLGIAENEIGALNAYPNPATAAINLGLSEEGVKSILVTDLQGKIYELNYSVFGDKVVLASDGLKAGVYFIRAEYASGKVEAAKITKL